MTETKTPVTTTAKNGNGADPTKIAANTSPQQQENNQISDNHSTKSLATPAPAATTTAAKPGDQPAVETISTNTPKEVVEQIDPAADLTAEEQANLERILDGDDDDAPASLSGEDDRDLAKEAINKIKRLVVGIPSTSPDAHTIWGAAGVTLTLGDLRALVKHVS